MKSLKTRFFIFISGLGIIVSLGVGILMYSRYQNYIIDSYRTTLSEVAALVQKRMPELADTQYLLSGAREQSPDFWARIEKLDQIAVSFNMLYIYYMEKVGDKYRFLLSSDWTPDTIDIDILHDPDYIGEDMDIAYKERTLRIADKPVANEYGNAISAYVPIIKDGAVSGVLGLDFEISFVKRLEQNAIIALFISLIPVIILAGIFAYILALSLTRPIARLAETVRRIGSGDLAAKIIIKGNDEIAELGNAFNKMTGDIKAHIENISRITAEKERVNAELSIASEIQNDMLPKIFPKFTSHKWLALFAKMISAKQVGGDFYDFFYLNDEETKAVFVIADVSGKGVPAALFMVIAKTLIKAKMLRGLDPASALREVNDQLSEDNTLSMFVTVFLVCLDLETGKMTYANAGHNRPLISQNNEPYRFMELKKGIPLGMLEGSEYQLCEIGFHSGDRLYLYTDGVNEAMNTLEEQWGNDRFLESANKHRDLLPEEFDTAIRNDIAGFVSGAEQSDDITTLAIYYK
ncbi:PP2C family protein-serine/threonine phosphatase [Treponema primitia]|uniref:PP2C family protein-serine/threonine phosphatase n=1 Tax=Treponema primitia TaxID=88058 RepID=UPI0002555786|nr:SpoIIE family protein phosphatase [Treponema primitia]